MKIMKTFLTAVLLVVTCSVAMAADADYAFFGGKGVKKDALAGRLGLKTGTTKDVFELTLDAKLIGPLRALKGHADEFTADDAKPLLLKALSVYEQLAGEEEGNQEEENLRGFLASADADRKKITFKTKGGEGLIKEAIAAKKDEIALFAIQSNELDKALKKIFSENRQLAEAPAVGSEKYKTLSDAWAAYYAAKQAKKGVEARAILAEANRMTVDGETAEELVSDQIRRELHMARLAKATGKGPTAAEKAGELLLLGLYDAMEEEDVGALTGQMKVKTVAALKALKDREAERIVSGIAALGKLVTSKAAEKIRLEKRVAELERQIAERQTQAQRTASMQKPVAKAPSASAAFGFASKDGDSDDEFGFGLLG